MKDLWKKNRHIERWIQSERSYSEDSFEGARNGGRGQEKNCRSEREEGRREERWRERRVLRWRERLEGRGVHVCGC